MAAFYRRKYPSMRLAQRDYGAAGRYFVTICTHQRAPIFGEVHHRIMRLNEWGCLAWEAWYETGALRKNVRLEAFIVMPDHVHGLLTITHALRSEQLPRPFKAPVQTLGSIVGGYKRAVTRAIKRQLGADQAPVIWQRGYHDHIVRSGPSFGRIRQYIEDNPLGYRS